MKRNTGGVVTAEKYSVLRVGNKTSCIGLEAEYSAHNETKCIEKVSKNTNSIQNQSQFRKGDDFPESLRRAQSLLGQERDNNNRRNGPRGLREVSFYEDNRWLKKAKIGSPSRFRHWSLIVPILRK